MNSSYASLLLHLADAPRLKKKGKEQPKAIESNDELAAWLNIEN